MLPTVAEIVFVDKCITGVDNVIQPHMGFISGIVRKFGIRNAVAYIIDNELMQMAVFPAHGGLQDVVQSAEFYVSRNLNAPPDLRADVFQGDFDLEDVQLIKPEFKEPLNKSFVSFCTLEGNLIISGS
jgi:hypothetical protein